MRKHAHQTLAMAPTKFAKAIAVTPAHNAAAGARLNAQVAKRHAKMTHVGLRVPANALSVIKIAAVEWIAAQVVNAILQ